MRRSAGLTSGLGSGSSTTTTWPSGRGGPGLRWPWRNDLFVHHFGSRTFRGNGIDAEKLLDENARRFADKWGLEKANGKRVELRPWPNFLADSQREFAREVDEPRSNGEHVPHANGVAPATRTVKVSLTMIVRDEEKNLPHCLESVRGVFDEIVVIDTGSTDRTREIAREFGAKVFNFPWVDSFSAARNEALSHATGDYAFWLDADDVVEPGEKEKLRALLDGLKRPSQGAARPVLGARARAVDRCGGGSHDPALGGSAGHGSHDPALGGGARRGSRRPRPRAAAAPGGSHDPALGATAGLHGSAGTSPSRRRTRSAGRGSHDPAPGATGGLHGSAGLRRAQSSRASPSRRRARSAGAGLMTPPPTRPEVATARREPRPPADGAAAYVVRCACDPGPGGTGGETVVDHVRLFPLRDDVRWTYRVHEQILPALRRAKVPVRWTDLIVRHTGYADPALRARKLERDIRLLHLDLLDRPDDPFILFNLGAIAVERREWNEAIGFLERSLAGSAPSDSIVRKLFALIARAHQMLGDTQQALATCARGLELDREDAELWFRKGILHRHRGEPAEAERSWRRILGLRRPEQFCSFDQGIYGHLTRRNLAALAAERGDRAEAEKLWQAVLAECPGDRDALAALGLLPARPGVDDKA